jgi:DNA-binding transcriptional ArsR family regulator
LTRSPYSAAPPFLFDHKMAKALANPWRNRILSELHIRSMSPSEFSDETGLELAGAARYFRQLRDWGFLEIAEERRGGDRRGAVEHVHRAIQRVHFNAAAWEGLPPHLRSECSGSMIEAFILRINQAMEAETFDAETDRHLSWKALSLDRQSWTELSDRLDEILDWVFVLEIESAERLAASSEEPIPTTVGLFSFRSPKASEVASKGK